MTRPPVSRMPARDPNAAPATVCCRRQPDRPHLSTAAQHRRKNHWTPAAVINNVWAMPYLVMRRSRRAWGWHPLVDEWAAKVVADANVRPGQYVLDIGAGTGALTRHLVAAGARVLAIEPHPGRADVLQERFAGQPVTVLRIDARELVLPRRPFRVVANPPYSITSDLVRKLLKTPSGMVAADLVLQRAAARRFSDPARVPPRWRTEIGRTVPRKAFRPPPQVDSAVLVIRRRFR